MITTLQAANDLGISRSRVYKLIRAGRIKAKKSGGTWLIDPRVLRSVRNRKTGRPKKKK